MTTQIRRWVATRPGGLEVFELVEDELPPPAAGEVTIEVRAAGMNPADAKHIANGDFSEPQPVGYEVAAVTGSSRSASAAATPARSP